MSANKICVECAHCSFLCALMFLCVDTVQVGVVYPLSPPPPLEEDCLALELMEYLLKCLTSQVIITTLL